ncbi:MAG: CBS domain-containing protein [Rhodospirillaceae bacterium]|nr:CBS domain-containing protein [Rhodospirillaceae bacterium]
MVIKSILDTKKMTVLSVPMGMSVRDVAQMFGEKQIGFALVTDKGKNVGTISERDIVKAFANIGGEVADVPVSKIATKKIVSCHIDDTVDKVRDLMTNERTRHVIVMKDNAIVGLISIGDIVKHSLDECRVDGNAMREYIAGQGYQ